MNLVNKAKELSSGPTLKALEDTSDDLYSWAATRVARDCEVTAEELLESGGFGFRGSRCSVYYEGYSTCW